MEFLLEPSEEELAAFLERNMSEEPEEETDLPPEEAADGEEKEEN